MVAIGGTPCPTSRDTPSAVSQKLALVYNVTLPSTVKALNFMCYCGPAVSCNVFRPATLEASTATACCTWAVSAQGGHLLGHLLYNFFQLVEAVITLASVNLIH